MYFPSRALSTDNAAMIAAAAYPKFLRSDFAPLDFTADANLKLGVADSKLGVALSKPGVATSKPSPR